MRRKSQHINKDHVHKNNSSVFITSITVWKEPLAQDKLVSFSMPCLRVWGQSRELQFILLSWAIIPLWKVNPTYKGSIQLKQIPW
jgi:hypothetical protein